jgi:hypothetical protein
MFEPILPDEREERSLIGEISPKRETARERAWRKWGMKPDAQLRDSANDLEAAIYSATREAKEEVKEKV